MIRERRLGFLSDVSGWERNSRASAFIVCRIHIKILAVNGKTGIDIQVVSGFFLLRKRTNAVLAKDIHDHGAFNRTGR